MNLRQVSLRRVLSSHGHADHQSGEVFIELRSIGFQVREIQQVVGGSVCLLSLQVRGKKLFKGVLFHLFKIKMK